MQNNIANTTNQILITNTRTHNERHTETHNGKYAKIRNAIGILRKRRKKTPNFPDTTNINMKCCFYNSNGTLK